MTVLRLDVAVTRGGFVESTHRVHAMVVDANGAVVASAGDSSVASHWRSCAKPFQVLPLLASGGFDQLGWGDDELALACGSHGGEPEHVALAAAMLSAVGLEEGDLACGAHDPLTPRGAKLLRETGSRPTRLHNNCSGKHAAMLALALTRGWSTEGYERDDHPVQRAALASVAEWTGEPPERIGRAVDGCGVTVFVLGLAAMARAYARFAAAQDADVPHAARVLHAMRTRPFLVGGTERFDTVLAEETEGRVVAKVGAEGVHSAAVPDRGLGIALKVEDGNSRAQVPALIRLLQELDVLPREALPPRLAELARRPLRNTRGEVVGEIGPLG